jgi:hypothetical protein
MGGGAPEIAQSGWGIVRLGSSRFAWVNNAANSIRRLEFALR